MICLFFTLASFVEFIREGKDKNTQYLNLMYCELNPNKTCRLMLPEIVVTLTRNKDLSAREKEVIAYTTMNLVTITKSEAS